MHFTWNLEASAQVQGYVHTYVGMHNNVSSIYNVIDIQEIIKIQEIPITVFEKLQTGLVFAQF